MVVRTETDRLRAHRKLIVELLFAERNHICAVCVMNGGCELQDLATELGYRPRPPALPVPHAVGRHQPRALRRGPQSLHSVHAVRAGSATRSKGAHTWDLSGRGAKSLVITDLGQSWGESDTCTNCGKCVQVCPTGALFEKGKSVSEMRKSRGFLKYIVTAREKGEWVR